MRRQQGKRRVTTRKLNKKEINAITGSMENASSRGSVNLSIHQDAKKSWKRECAVMKNIANWHIRRFVGM